MFKYRAIITNICDNELVDVAIDLGFGIVSNQKIKLAGIDSTEFRDKKDSTRALALKIKLAELLLNKEVTVKSLKAEKSGRYLAFFYLDNNQKSINDILVETGFAKLYVKKRDKMIIAVELDNVISSPVSNFVALTDVEKCTVIPGAKEALVQIQAQGHSILIYTNREASLGPATEMWLQKNKIPYDKIVLNKPRYDIYIDTKCFTFDTWEAFTEAKKYRLQNS